MKSSFFIVFCLFSVSSYALELGKIHIPDASNDDSSLPVFNHTHDELDNESADDQLVEVSIDTLDNRDVIPSAPSLHRLEDYELYDAVLSKTVTVGQWKGQGIEKAKLILSQAYARTNSSEYEGIFSKAYSKLHSVTIKLPPSGYDFASCSENTMDYTPTYGRTIYICRQIVDGAEYQVEELAQILIHELAHTVGYSNECDASSIEVSAMRLSDTGLKFRNGYLKRCGIN